MISKLDDYNSHNTKRLSLQEMSDLLLRLDFIESLIKGKYIHPHV